MTKSIQQILNMKSNRTKQRIAAALVTYLAADLTTSVSWSLTLRKEREWKREIWFKVLHRLTRRAFISSGNDLRAQVPFARLHTAQEVPEVWDHTENLGFIQFKHGNAGWFWNISSIESWWQKNCNYPLILGQFLQGHVFLLSLKNIESFSNHAGSHDLQVFQKLMS